MKNLKVGTLVLIALTLILTGCDKAQQDKKFGMQALNSGLVAPIPVNADNNCGEKYSTKLMAGQYTEVGELLVWVDGRKLFAQFAAYDGNLFSETHLAVENDPNEIPHTKSGNPKIGNFEFHGEYSPMESDVIYEINLDEKELTGVVTIAAHAVVNIPTGEEICLDLAQLEAAIPVQEVTIDSIFYRKVNSYYDLFLSNAGDFNGMHLAWCADNNHREVDFENATLISSYSSTYPLIDVVPDPSKLPHLNYLMNKYYPDYSFPVIQAAVWTLMNGFYNNPSGGINLNATRLAQYNMIMSDVLANGAAFIPGPGDYLVVLVHSGNRKEYQNLFILYKKCTPVYDDQTAWAQGNPLSEYDTPFTPDGGSWATYFGYCLGQ